VMREDRSMNKKEKNPQNTLLSGYVSLEI